MLAAAGLTAIGGAFGAGEIFVRNGQPGASLAMAILTGIALLCYVGMLALAAAAERQGTGPRPGGTGPQWQATAPGRATSVRAPRPRTPATPPARWPATPTRGLPARRSWPDGKAGPTAARCGAGLLVRAGMSAASVGRGPGVAAGRMITVRSAAGPGLT